MTQQISPEYFIKHILLITSTEDYSITKSGINFRCTLYINKTSTNIGGRKKLDIKLNECERAYIYDTDFETLENFPNHSKFLAFGNLKSLGKEIHINFSANELIMDKCPQVESIICDNHYLNFKNGTTLDRIAITDFKNSNLKYVEFTCDVNNIHLALSNCPQIKSFKQIKTQNNVFDYLIVNGDCGIQSFDDFRWNINNLCALSLPHLKNFKGVENVVSNGSLRLTLGRSYANLINIMNNKSRYINLINDDDYSFGLYRIHSDQIRTIISQYTDHHVEYRSNYIMDCALELIENGFGYVAEL